MNLMRIWHIGYEPNGNLSVEPNENLSGTYVMSLMRICLVHRL